jgi:hypothetical protein
MGDRLLQQTNDIAVGGRRLAVREGRRMSDEPLTIDRLAAIGEYWIILGASRQQEWTAGDLMANAGPRPLGPTFDELVSKFQEWILSSRGAVENIFGVIASGAEINSNTRTNLYASVMARGGQVMTIASLFMDWLDRYFRYLESGRAVVEHPPDAIIRCCPGRGLRTGECLNALRPDATVCAGCGAVSAGARSRPPKPLRVVGQLDAGGRALAVSPDGKCVAVAATHTIHLWMDGCPRHDHPTPLPVDQIRFGPDGQELLAAPIVIDMESLSEKWRLGPMGDSMDLPPILLRSAWGPRGDTLCCLVDTVERRELRLFNRASRASLFMPAAPGDDLIGVGASVIVVAGAEIKSIDRSYSVRGVKCPPRARALALDEAKKLLGIAAHDGSLNLYRLDNAALSFHSQLFEAHHRGAATSIAISPTDDLLATSGDDRMLRLWMITPIGAEFLSYAHLENELDEPPNALVFAPDGNRLYAVGNDRVLVFALD